MFSSRPLASREKDDDFTMTRSYDEAGELARDGYKDGLERGQGLRFDDMDLGGPYPGCLNGVGGKIEETDLNPTNGALRELLEETGIERKQLLEFNWLTQMLFPSGVELHVFYGVLSNGFTFTQMEDEPLEWFLVCGTHSRFAGEGNISYFINAALIALRE